MTTFRAAFTVDLVDGKPLDDEFVRTAFDEVLEDMTSVTFFAADDDGRESEYEVSLGVVEVVA